MRKNFKTFFSFLLIVPVLLASSCSKDDEPTQDLATTKKNWVTGTWKQKDVQLAYPIKFMGQKLPVGFSLLSIAEYLPVTGPMLTCTADNVFSFDAKGSFSITGCTELILPNTGNAGTWNMQVYGSALHLIGSGNTDQPMWVDQISATNMRLGSLSYTIHVAEANADIPVYLVFEKQ